MTKSSEHSENLESYRKSGFLFITIKHSSFFLCEIDLFPNSYGQLDD